MDSKFLIRCDADTENGFGHFSRCLNLARGIKNKQPESKIVFLGNFDKIPADFIKKYQMECEGRPSMAKEFEFAQNFDYFILDSYSITQEYIDKYRHMPIKFVKFDDFSGFQLDDVDLVINMCFRSTDHIYSSQKSCLGVRYFPAREELREIRLKNINQFKEHIEHIVIFLGAADKNDAGAQVTKMLDKILRNTRISLISNKTMGHLASSVNGNRVQYLPISFDIEKYLKDADAVITGGGVTMYDCAYSCIANAALNQNKHQEEDTLPFSKAGLTYYLGMAQSLEDNEDMVIQNFRKFCSPQVRKSIVQCAREKFFINSTQNLVDAVLGN